MKPAAGRDVLPARAANHAPGRTRERAARPRAIVFAVRMDARAGTHCVCKPSPGGARSRLVARTQQPSAGRQNSPATAKAAAANTIWYCVAVRGSLLSVVVSLQVSLGRPILVDAL
ncbi:hypothetical protein MRX96_042273 [Rhipicephalus microplus]